MAKGHAQGRGDQATLVTSPHTPLAPVSDNVGGASRWPEPTTLCCTWHDRTPPRPAVGTQLPQRLPSPASPAVLASWPMTLPESFSPGAGCAPSAPSLDVALRFRPQHCANTAIPVSARERRPSPFAGSPSPPVLALGAPGLACGPGVLPPCRQQGAREPGRPSHAEAPSWLPQAPALCGGPAGRTADREPVLGGDPAPGSLGALKGPCLQLGALAGIQRQEKNAR